MQALGQCTQKRHEGSPSCGAIRGTREPFTPRDVLLLVGSCRGIGCPLNPGDAQGYVPLCQGELCLAED